MTVSPKQEMTNLRADNHNKWMEIIRLRGDLDRAAIANVELCKQRDTAIAERDEYVRQCRDALDALDAKQAAESKSQEWWAAKVNSEAERDSAIAALADANEQLAAAEQRLAEAAKYIDSEAYLVFNRRRGALIDKKVRETIEPHEEAELEALQLISGALLSIVHPEPISTIQDRLIESLEKSLAAARADQERWRACKVHGFPKRVYNPEHRINYWRVLNDDTFPVSPEAAIDAAIKALAAGKERGDA